MKEEFFTGSLPVLALRGLAVYPEQTIHFDIGRIKSVLALEAAMKRDQVLMLAPQKDLRTCIQLERLFGSSKS